MRVMSFNIRGATTDDGQNNWPNRADLNVKTILSSQPDLIGWQECEMGNYVVYQERLKDYVIYLGYPYNRPGRVLYNAIGWRNDAYQLLDAGSFYISKTPEFWSSAWDTARVRNVTWVSLRQRQSGHELNFLNVHLDHVSEQARLEGAKLMASFISQLDDNQSVLVTGDFNSLPQTAINEESVYGILRAAQLRDSALIQSDRFPHTFHGFKGDAFKSRQETNELRIDWILYRGSLQPSHYAVIRQASPPIYPSDHYPIVTDFMSLTD